MDAYQIRLHHPELKNLKRLKLVFDIVLIVFCIIGAVLLEARSQNLDRRTFFSLSASVFFSAGVLPVILSLPLVSARLFVGKRGGGFFQLNKCQSCICCRDAQHALAYLSYAVFVALGFVLSYLEYLDTGGDDSGGNNTNVTTNTCDADEGDWADGLVSRVIEIFAEVALIYLVTTVFQIPTVDEDLSRAVLTPKEYRQIQNSGSISANWVDDVDMAFEGVYHADLKHLYPAEIHTGRFKFKKSAVQGAASGDAKQLTKKMNETAAGWDSPYFVAALGRCDKDTLGRELEKGLITNVSGASPYNDRYITQVAITSLGSLYFGMKDRKLSQRIFDLWAYHEISNVRDHCVTTINAIAYEPVVNFIKELNNVSKYISSVDSAMVYYTSRQCLTAPLMITSLEQAIPFLSSENSYETRIMALFAVCALLKDGRRVDDTNAAALPLSPAIASTTTPFILACETHVLGNPFEGHVAQTLALAAWARLARYLRNDKTIWTNVLKTRMWVRCNTRLRTSVFKSIRTAATEVLEASKYPYLGLYHCFGGEATKLLTNEGFEASTLKKLLTRHVEPDLFKQLEVEVKSMTQPLKDLEQAFKDFEQNSSIHPNKDPALLFYFHLMLFGTQGVAKWVCKDRFIQDRLNSTDRLERYVALVAVGMFMTSSPQLARLRKELIPGVTAVELISDVRDLANVIIGAERMDWLKAITSGCIPVEITDHREQLVSQELANLKQRIEDGDESSFSGIFVLDK
eukprot:m.216546 g.216546  ORF g.216546 m.216546 type:complete len:744 (-) comp33211_c0_seq4:307-2538(-)